MIITNVVIFLLILILILVVCLIIIKSIQFNDNNSLNDNSSDNKKGGNKKFSLIKGGLDQGQIDEIITKAEGVLNGNGSDGHKAKIMETIDKLIENIKTKQAMIDEHNEINAEHIAKIEELNDKAEYLEKQYEDQLGKLEIEKANANAELDILKANSNMTQSEFTKNMQDLTKNHEEEKGVLKSAFEIQIQKIEEEKFAIQENTNVIQEELAKAGEEKAKLEDMLGQLIDKINELIEKIEIDSRVKGDILSEIQTRIANADINLD